MNVASFSHRNPASYIPFLLIQFFIILRLQAQPSSTPREDFWITDGIVQAIAETNGVVYLGGNFSSVGPYTGGGAPVDLETGQAMPPYPKVNGSVRAVVSDGNGGWFIGGAFNRVGNLPVDNLAHVRSDGAVDSAWNPRVLGGEIVEVNALLRAGSTIYVGGSFSQIGNLPRNNAAAVDATSGQVTAWNPNASDAVNALAVAGNTIYVVGNFTNISGQTRGRIAAIDAVTAQAQAWQATANSNVWTVVVSGTNVYVGGSFTSINGGPGFGLAALDAATGQATNWRPALGFFFGGGFGVYAIVVSNNTVFVGGNLFFSAGNQFLEGLGAIDATTGRVVATFRPTAQGGFFFGRREIRTLALAGQTLYAGGIFSSLGGQPRNFVAALSATNGAATAWNPNANGTVLALGISGNSIYTGGDFTSVGRQSRTNFAALDAATSQATAWHPTVSSNVLAMAISDNKLYIGGAFSRINNLARSRVAALDLATGEPTSWSPAVNGVVQALAISGTNLYLGGKFTTVAELPRNLLAAISTDTGQATDWDPNAMGGGQAEVKALTISSNRIYVGGSFTTIGGLTRNNIAALDSAAGQVSTWNPNIFGTVAALTVVGDTVYVGGSFSKIGVQIRNNIAAINVNSGKPTLWNPGAAGNVNSLASVGNLLYAGGDFLTIGGQPRSGLAEIDLSSAAVLPWDPQIGGGDDPSVLALAATSRAVYAGGNFISINDTNRPFLAAFDLPSSGGNANVALGGVKRLDDGRFRFQATGTGGQRMIIETSSDLVQWSNVSTNSLSGSSFQIDVADDKALGARQRFYRAVIQP